MAPQLHEWKREDGEGAPAKDATFHDDESVGVRGVGQDCVYWRTHDVPLTPGGVYVFRVRAQGTGSGTLIVGPNRVNRDFAVPKAWTTLSYALRIPDTGDTPFLRLGQWHVSGEASFREPELVEARLLHRRWGALELGEGERLENGHYIDRHALDGPLSTIHRTLATQSAGFNTNRWTLGDSESVVYRHALPFELKGARVRVRVCHRSEGAIEVLASRDGNAWTSLGEVAEVTERELDLPAALFPCKEVSVQVRARGGWLQVDGYALEGQVAYDGPDRTGGTHVIEERVSTPGLEATWEEVGGTWAVSWTNKGDKPVVLDLASGEGHARSVQKSVPLSPGKPVVKRFSPSELTAGPHRIVFSASRGSDTLYEGWADVVVTALSESAYGSPLAPIGKDIALWWCEGAWKVGAERPAPEGKPVHGITIEAARGEYEPAQLVLRSSKKGTTLVALDASDLVGPATTIPASEVTLREVARVHIESPTDSLGEVGDWPDPLPSLLLPLPLEADRNAAIWVLVHVPEAALGGEYHGTLRVKTTDGDVEVPLTVHVFDFALPKTPSLRSGFGVDAHRLMEYHAVGQGDDLRSVWDLTMRDFAAHRIAPYSFFQLDPIRVHEEDGHARVDWTAFDGAAKRCIDDLGFNAFSLPVQGMGWGSYHERNEGEILGRKAGTPEFDRLFGEYARELETHLRERGWLDEAYVYWFDEPEPKDYPFVVGGMERLKKNAGGLTRMLTEQPEKELEGHVDLWCATTTEWTPERVRERRIAGDEVWWYLCTGPRAPYIGLFIDHPAVEMRLWPWQSWQYGVQGILIWQTMWWTSDTAFPETLQDPWADPMSYVSGYGVPKGSRQFWGNGDGRFLYPPRRDPNGAKKGIVAAPIPSIRWECLRDGVEDHDYFAMLKAEVERLDGKADAALLREARGLLTVHEQVSKDTVTFTSDVRSLLDHRGKVARMIERLQSIR